MPEGSRAPDASARITGYGPSIDARCRVLIVGSMPSIRSLELHEYYGHPQNRFWSFVQELFGIERALPHEERLARLRASGVALWDVVRACRRETSADSQIRDVLVNDFAALFVANPQLARVFCNGAKAHELWRRRVAAPLAAQLGREVPFVRLPSTSPANASQSPATKLAAWRAVELAARA